MHAYSRFGMLVRDQTERTCRSIIVSQAIHRIRKQERHTDSMLEIIVLDHIAQVVNHATSPFHRRLFGRSATPNTTPPSNDQTRQNRRRDKTADLSPPSITLPIVRRIRIIHRAMVLLGRDLEVGPGAAEAPAHAGGRRGGGVGAGRGLGGDGSGAGAGAVVELVGALHGGVVVLGAGFEGGEGGAEGGHAGAGGGLGGHFEVWGGGGVCGCDGWLVGW